MQRRDINLGFVMPTKVGTQTTIHKRDASTWLDPGIRRDDGIL
ncbi:MAG: hypothetical protein QM780_04995 [Hyphomicrobium sp.]